MSIITKYICDKCGASQDTSDQFWAVGLAYNTVNVPLNQPTVSVHLCRPCLEQWGLVPAVKGRPKAPELTKAEQLEELIQLIAAEAGHE